MARQGGGDVRYGGPTSLDHTLTGNGDTYTFNDLIAGTDYTLDAVNGIVTAKQGGAITAGAATAAAR